LYFLSSSRSVAELVIAEVIALSRQLVDRSSEMHAGVWNKVSKNCYEVRNKTLGIVGYGHIGTQLSVLAEAMGMDVLYYDVLPIMPLGQACQVDSLEELLSASDFLTLHVPELPETTNLIGRRELGLMKKGSYLINNARGKVVDLEALAEILESGHLAGAAVDVFPREPKTNGPYFNDNLNGFEDRFRKLPNLILTPHIGGSTEEAQRAIGAEVSNALVRYINFGASLGSVNFPEVTLRPIIADGIVRLCYAHLNQPGVLRAVNAVLGDYNVERQLSDSKGDIAYLMVTLNFTLDDGVLELTAIFSSSSQADIADVGPDNVRKVYEEVQSLPSSVATRILF
jgi:D-3-phosphoglycerate dehydrogenase